MIAPQRLETTLPALVLTAGLGTRLEPLTYVRAKAAVPVNGITLARRVIGWLASEGISDVVLNLHHLPASITASVGDGSDLGTCVRYSWENPVLGSAGGPRHALPLLIRQSPQAERQQSFLIVNGDTLTDVHLAAMSAAHAASGAAVTMALIPNPRPDKYGGVLVSDDGWITGFTRAGAGRPSYHFVGVQIADSRAFNTLTDGVAAETVNGIYPQLIAEDRRSIGGYICDAAFRDIGRPADYLETSAALAELEGDRLANGNRVEIHPTASVVRTAIWDDVKIGASAELVECIICDRAVVPSGARYHRCAILPAQGRAPKGQQRLDGDLLIAAF